jgi:hypothetical protein
MIDADGFHCRYCGAVFEREFPRGLDVSRGRIGTPTLSEHYMHCAERRVVKAREADEQQRLRPTRSTRPVTTPWYIRRA